MSIREAKVGTPILIKNDQAINAGKNANANESSPDNSIPMSNEKLKYLAKQIIK